MVFEKWKTASSIHFDAVFDVGDVEDGLVKRQ